MQLGHEMALHIQPMLQPGKHALESPALPRLHYPFNLCTVALLALISRCSSWGRQQLPFPPWPLRLQVAAEEPKTTGEIRVKCVLKGGVRQAQLLVLWPDLAEMLMIIRYI